MSRLNYFFCLLLCWTAAGAAYGQQVKSSQLSRDSVLIGDQVEWSTLFSVPESVPVVAEPYAPVLQRQPFAGKKGEELLYDDASRIEVIRELTLDTLSVRDGVRELSARAILTSFDSGYFKLPLPVIVCMTPEGPDTLRFDPPVLEVATIPVDTASFTPFDIKGQIGYPIRFSEVLPWILLAAGIAVLIYVVYRYVKYKRENRDFFGKPVVQDPPHIVALRELDRLRTQKLWQNGKEKQFYTGITDTLRAYIEKRYGVSAMEKTSSEILESLSGEHIEAKPYRELEELFEISDLVKFAKYTPLAADNEEAVPKAVRFVNSTFMQELEEEKGGK